MIAVVASLLLLLVNVLAPVSAATGAQSQQPGAVLHVDVTDGTGAPIPNHDVHIEDAPHRRADAALTAGD